MNDTSSEETKAMTTMDGAAPEGTVFTASNIVSGDAGLILGDTRRQKKKKRLALIVVIILLILFSPIIIIISWYFIGRLVNYVTDKVESLVNKGGYEIIAELDLSETFPEEDKEVMQVARYWDPVILGDAINNEKLYITYRINGTCPLGLYLAQIDLERLRVDWTRNIAENTPCYNITVERSSISIYNDTVIVSSDEKMTDVEVYDKNGTRIGQYSNNAWARSNGLEGKYDKIREIYYVDGIHTRSEGSIDRSTHRQFISEEFDDDESWVKDGYKIDDRIDLIIGDTGTYIAHYSVCRSGFMGYCDKGYSTVRREYDRSKKLLSSQTISGIVPEDGGFFIYNGNEYSYKNQKGTLQIIKVNWE